MPEKRQMDIEARALHAGDFVTDAPAKYTVFVTRRVAHVDVKTKLAHVELVDVPAGPAVRSVPLDTKLTVEREVLTAEEEAENYRIYVGRWIDSSIKSAAGDLEDAREKLDKDLSHTFHLYSSSLDAHVRAQVVAGLWLRVTRMAEMGGLDLVSALVKVSRKVADELTHFDPALQSTSVMSSALESLSTSATSSWLRTVRFRIETL